MKKIVDKTINEVLEQKYITSYDLQVLIPELSYNKAVDYIKMFREKMKSNGYFVPDGKTKVALTKIVKKELGL